MVELNWKDIAELETAFLEIQQPRTPYVLKDLVVNTKFTPEQKYAQCVLEMQIAYDNLCTAKHNAEIKEIEIKRMWTFTKTQKANKAIKEIELKQLNRTRVWALREFEFLYNLRKSFDKRYTRDELNDAQPMEYKKRLEIQARHDIIATGRISQSNCEWLRQIGVDPLALTAEFAWMLPAGEWRDNIETRYLEEWKVRVLLVVLTREIALSGLPCLEGVTLPTTMETKLYNIHGRQIADGYNHAIETAIKEDCDYLVTVEDDTFPQPDAIHKLFEFIFKNPDTCVGAWYPKREKPRQWVHIIVEWWHRKFLNDDWETHEVKTMAMWCSIYPVKILKSLQYPYCKTTDNLSQDSYLSQKIRDAGFKLFVDTSVKCRHIDRETKEVFE